MVLLSVRIVGCLRQTLRFQSTNMAWQGHEETQRAHLVLEHVGVGRSGTGLHGTMSV